MSTLAIIPARGGSKRIPHKNVKDFLGKPLLAYALSAIEESGLFEKVVVSTDDEEIATAARRYGAEVPFMRSKELADDFTGTEAVTHDAAVRVEQLGFKADYICCVYATAPLLTGYWLKKAYDRVREAKTDYLYACCEFPFPIQRAQYLEPDGTPVPVMPECMPMRSQDLRKTYQDAGLFYFYSHRYLIEGVRDNLVCRGFELPRYRVIDIDTPEDFTVAKAMYTAISSLNLP
ncbi:MAG: pseudaminic acid cytidylyltransferase [Succinivibrio sp.]|nr:pseudaminic acid cytidylyltransferase [Succinivibrio sp.]